MRVQFVVSLTAAALVLASACSDQAVEGSSQTLLPDSASYSGVAFSPDGLRMAYVAVSGSRASVWTADANGANRKQVSAASSWADAPSWSPDGKNIAYGADQFGPPDIFVVPADGGESRRLTTDAGLEFVPMWMADGTVLYSGNRAGNFDLYSIALTGEESVQLSSAPSQEIGRASRDGSMIAFQRVVGDSNTVWVMKPGEAARALTTEGREGFNDWSFDGSLIAYESSRSGRSDIWVVPSAGGEPRQLTNDVRADFGARFSPDGKWIAYLSDRGGQRDVWVVPVAGGESVRITDDKGEETELVWSPDGQSLLFAYEDNKSNIWVSPLDGGAARKLTDTDDSGPVVSPDGKRVAFTSNRNGNVDLLVVPIDGGEPVALASSSNDETEAAWSPDGRWVAYVSARGADRSLMVVASEGGEARALTDGMGVVRQPVWSADGRTIYFVSDREAALSDIWSVSVDGGAAQRVTHFETAGFFQISKDGERIAIHVMDASGGGSLRIQSLTGGQEAVVPSPGYVGLFSLSPNSPAIAFMAHTPEGAFDIYVQDRPGVPVRRLTVDPSWDLSPVWLPDGSAVMFLTGARGNVDIALVPVGGGEIRYITSTPVDEGGAQLTPDGKSVVYAAGSSFNSIRRVSVAAILGGM